MDAVTGAFSYLGSYIAEALLRRGRRVLTLSRERDSAHRLSEHVSFAPLQFGDPAQLAAALHGVDTLYNTYWVRFPRGALTWEHVLANTRVLLGAAERAGVRRLVQISVSNCALDVPFPYFRAKAVAERALLGYPGFSHAIVRPTLIFGSRDILVNQGRATHIHVMAYVGGRAGSTYSGGTEAHTGQLFFKDATTDKVAKLSPYSSRVITRVRNSADNISRRRGSGQLVSLKLRGSSIVAGFTGTITMGIDVSQRAIKHDARPQNRSSPVRGAFW